MQNRVGIRIKARLKPLPPPCVSILSKGLNALCKLDSNLSGIICDNPKQRVTTSPYNRCISILGIFFGIIAALRQNKFVDRVLMVLSTLGATIPSFVFATGFLYLFSKILGWVPSFGVNSWKGYIGPVIVSALFSLAYVVRLTRTSTLDVLNQDYIRTARAKGLPEWKVLGKHALRNALLPVVTYIGPMFAALITGSFVVEKVFGIPGIGNLFTNSILNRDYTLIMGITVFFSVILVICILVVDILYVLIDPRIKYQ